MVSIIETDSNIIIKDWDYLDMELFIGHSKYWGYCWWQRPPKSTKVKIYIGEIYRYAPNSFVYFFWEVLHHEFLHAIGYRIKFKNYSSKKDTHFVWICERILDYLVEIWAEDDRMDNIRGMFTW